MDYSKFQNISAIYQITSLIDGKKYIGSAVKLRNRLNRHYNDLINNRHCSKYLQNSFNKYGNDNFEIIILELCEKEMLLIKEQYYLDLYKSYNREYGFNTCEIAGSPSKKILSEETKNKISNSMKGRKHSDETKIKIGKSNKNKKMSSDSIEKIRLSKIGKKQSKESVEKRAIDYSFIDSEGNIYIGKNLKQFCDEHNLFRPNMKKVLTGERKSHHGFMLYKN